VSASPERSGSFRSLLAVAAAVMVVALGVAAARSYRELKEIRKRETTLIEGLKESRERSEEMREEIDLVLTDPATLERLAREDLGLVRPQDVVVLLPPD